jgi:hypothetical protein
MEHRAFRLRDWCTFLIVASSLVRIIGGDGSTKKTLCPHLWKSECPRVKAAEELAFLFRDSPYSLAQRLAMAQLSIKALEDNIPGDFVDIGAGMGGIAAAIMIKALNEHDDETRLREHGSGSGNSEMPGARQVWMIDPFQGTAEATVPSNQAAKRDPLHELNPTAVIGSHAGSTVGELCDVLKRFGVLDFGRLRMVAGDVATSLSRIPLLGNSKVISFLRLDAGLPCAAIRYILTALYPRVSPGGIVYIDGYVSSGCDMQSFHGASILPVVETGGKHHAVWWSKFVGPKRY